MSNDGDGYEDPTLDEIIASWGGETAPLTQKVHAAFALHTGLDGLREAFYLGVESRNCESTIPSPYARDDPKHRAFRAGYSFGIKLWGTHEP